MSAEGQLQINKQFNRWIERAWPVLSTFCSVHFAPSLTLILYWVHFSSNRTWSAHIGIAFTKANWISNNAPPSSIDSQLLLPYYLCHAQPSPNNINLARINVQTILTLALECRWGFPEECSMNDLWTSFRDRISLLTSKATPLQKPTNVPCISLLYMTWDVSNPRPP